MRTRYLRAQACKTYSESQIASLRGGLTQIDLGSDVTIVAVGSLARREASEYSDLDYFAIGSGGVVRDGVMEEVNAAVAALGLRPPSANGAFARVITEEEFLGVIGGSDESNDVLTRRMLFLLESEWLYGDVMYMDLFKRVIARYIGENITQHQLARFFLNDLIRYYRTICVDFAYKTAIVGKSWGDRNLKLMFSRKLLYFSGVLAAAETAQSACDFKRSELFRLLALHPTERIKEVCGRDSERVLASYDVFLGWMADGAKRAILQGTSGDRETHSNDFREMKNAAHRFTWELENLLHRRYAPTHPIFQALLF